MIVWKRRGRGSYLAQVDGHRVAIVHMKGDGPNAPRWQGPVAAWQVRVGGVGDYDIGATVKHTDDSLAGAKTWVAENLTKTRLESC